MAKPKSVFVCQSCGAKHPKWQGQCTSCGEWNTLSEEIEAGTVSKGGGLVQTELSQAEISQIVTSLPEVEALKSTKERFSTTIGELDRVLGGGLVSGSVILLGGEPGIGKSTLLTQMVLGLINEKQTTKKQAQTKDDSQEDGLRTILYVAGEESPTQINLRIKRIFNNEQFISDSGFGQPLGSDSGQKRAKSKAKNKKNNSKNQLSSGEQLKFITSSDVDRLTAVIRSIKPDLVVVDSIQTLTTTDLTGASGSIGQLRECTQRLIDTVKPMNIPVFLVGHVTKEGSIAGPKVLEHMVDAVVELTGERTGQFRLLRALKNRFGATDEVGVFRVAEYGLAEVSNPSELFIDQADLSVPGSAVVCTMEGTRPLLVEVQALVNSTQLAMPRRVGRGIELSRIQVLAAVLQKHCRLPLGQQDIFLSAAGGFKLKEPAIDLGLAAAIASSLHNKSLAQDTIFIGEVGLLGEVRSVSYLERRIKEAKRLGFKQIVSAQSHKSVKQVLSDHNLLKK